jgi:hypothetical protein
MHININLPFYFYFCVMITLEIIFLFSKHPRFVVLWACSNSSYFFSLCYLRPILFYFISHSQYSTELNIVHSFFTDIDFKNFRTISSVAVYCLYLLLCILFVIQLPKITLAQRKPNMNSSHFQAQSYVVVIQDLSQPLKLDRKIRENIFEL